MFQSRSSQRTSPRFSVYGRDVSWRGAAFPRHQDDTMLHIVPQRITRQKFFKGLAFRRITTASQGIFRN